jgi:uncharacterized protein DUF4124
MNKWLWIALSTLLILPLAANAEVYKWKDKDGTVRYSDTPPPSNMTQLPITGKKAAPAAAIVQPSENVTAAPKAANADTKKKSAIPEGAAVKRQEKAEEDKKAGEQKDAELKQKQQNCTNAQNNFNSYKIGGRMSKTNEKGEREYLGDADIAAGLAQAQKDVDQYCE